jgi:4-hydroxybenzoate polyprenyltransferase
MPDLLKRFDMISRMFQSLKGFAQFISVERGFMLFMFSVAAKLLIDGKLVWPQAIYLGILVFCGWSAVDAINNICDVDLDVKSDPFRARYTKSLGKGGIAIYLLFCVLTLTLSYLTNIPLLLVLVLSGGAVGLLYSAPPIRLRLTKLKPAVNFSVGAIPVLLAASPSNLLTVKVWSLVISLGLATAVYSLWADLADYSSDLTHQARTLPILLGYKQGMYATIFAGYSLALLMAFVGVVFALGPAYYTVLAALVVFLSIRLVLEHLVLFGDDLNLMNSLGKTLARDFVIIAIIQTTNMMVATYLKGT